MTRSVRRSPLQRVLATTAGLGMATTATLAASGPAFAATQDEQLAATQLDAGHYVVVMAEPPAATYEGGVRGLEATRPSEGEEFDSDSEEVDKYETHLQIQQEKLAAKADVDIQQSYTLAVNGFSAELTKSQALKLATDKGVLALAPDEARQLDTVHSPEFLGLTGKSGTWKQVGGVKNAGKGVVVGVIDTGITPENPSFSAKAVNRKSNGNKVGVPYRTKDGSIAMLKADGETFQGACEEGESFTADLCNQKIVSARYYSDGFKAQVPRADWSEFEYDSPRDGDGHGSHTAGTSVGNRDVEMAIDGNTFGKGSGMAPEAKLAVYKACWEAEVADDGGCFTSDLVSAVNQAIDDGVDVINYSISGPRNTITDPVELAFLSAASAGIFVSASAGNSGPTASTVAHNSPWTMTVAASTFHNYLGTVVLGNGEKFLGATSSSTGVPAGTATVLSDASGQAGKPAADVARCGPDTLDPAKVSGKIVVCDRGVYDRVAKSAEVKRTGGVGMILVNVTPGSLDADVHSVPTVHLSHTDRSAVRAYVAGTTAATSALLPGNSSGKPAPALPVVAGFSSRGPALANGGDLLKPDISAPGVNVLAAVAPGPHQGRDFDFLSGTSMSSPHIAGLAAIILGAQPEWSPSAVKSAMMTTAYDLKNDDGSTDTNLFNSASGHVDPTRFLNPGLVYEATADDYLAFLEGTGVDTGTGVEPIDPSNLNYPSIAVSEAVGPQTITRTLTAVTPGLYRASADMPGFTVKVTPSVLNFNRAGETRDVKITITRTTAPTEQYGFGHLTWSGGKTTVRSGIAVRPVAIAAPAEISGEGTSGSTSYTVTPGTSGNIAMTVHGLAAGEGHEDAGSPGPLAARDDAANSLYDFTVPAGSTVARFDLVAHDQSADLDLFAFSPSGSLLQAATGSASERLQIENPEPGTYTVIVNVYSTPDNGETTWTLNNYAVPDAAAGNLTVSPNPLNATAGRDTTVTASWSGLAADTPHLGYVTYEGSPARTFVTIGG